MSERKFKVGDRVRYIMWSSEDKGELSIGDVGEVTAVEPPNDYSTYPYEVLFDVRVKDWLMEDQLELTPPVPTKETVRHGDTVEVVLRGAAHVFGDGDAGIFGLGNGSSYANTIDPDAKHVVSVRVVGLEEPPVGAVVSIGTSRVAVRRTLGWFSAGQEGPNDWTQLVEHARSLGVPIRTLE